MRTLHPLRKVERLADPVHLGQSQLRASNWTAYSDEMFHSKTKDRGGGLRRVFDNDFKSICSMILKKLFTKYDMFRDLEKMSSFYSKSLSQQLPVMMETVQCVLWRESCFQLGGTSAATWSSIGSLPCKWMTRLKNCDRSSVNEIECRGYLGHETSDWY